MSDPELPTVLEAILFGAGRSMSLEELSEMLGEPERSDPCGAIQP
jgi:hypothetical protein